jgi:chromate transporter
MVQLYPGPMMVNLMTYIGYQLRGVPGAIITTTGFILPSFILMLVLSGSYFALGELPWVSQLLAGLEALIVGLIFHIALDFAARNIQNRIQAFISLIAFIALSLRVDVFLIILAALAIGSWLLYPDEHQILPSMSTPQENRSVHHWNAIIVVAGIVLTGIAFAWLLRSDVGKMGLIFFKIGAVAFGSGTTIIPLIQADVVDTYHWLTLNQFIDGIALGQVTPGPFLITAAFIGYKLGGILGAMLATFAIFSPSFVMTLVFAKSFAHLRNSRLLRGMLAGILSSFAGLLAVVTLQMGAHAIKGPVTLALAASGFISIRYFRVNVIWIIFAGLAVWGGLSAIGVNSSF